MAERLFGAAGIQGRIFMARGVMRVHAVVSNFGEGCHAPRHRQSLAREDRGTEATSRGRHHARRDGHTRLW
ncbi:hypothetical protein BCPG_05370 [Burkholderia cenocepacia PC184]|nr:hypothetical protein BCPG_05370 [Burkholderia cenocepacia PC184]